MQAATEKWSQPHREILLLFGHVEAVLEKPFVDTSGFKYPSLLSPSPPPSPTHRQLHQLVTASGEEVIPPPSSPSRLLTAMLPRRQSIFHVGEEGGAGIHHRGGFVGAAAMATGGGGGGRRARERLVVGLQILVHHHHHHGRQVHAANVVLKHLVRPPRAAAVSCSFLKACSLCRRELSHDKDVYMYRGDQGFCSEECRWQQILVDEAREREAAAGGKERQRRGQARHHSPHRTPPIRGRPPRKTLAVAA
ncbi:hypothetical protein ACP70R_017559 [Stipagrostis hirtigluma subsp. patula]